MLRPYTTVRVVVISPGRLCSLRFQAVRTLPCTLTFRGVLRSAQEPIAARSGGRVCSKEVVSMKQKLAWGFILGIAIVAGIALFTKVAVRSAPPYPADFAAAVQSGIASQAPCPSSYGDVPQAVENAASFITYRSGATLSQAIKQKLSLLEQSAMSGPPNASGLTRQQVKDGITANFMNAASSVTDAQIENMTTTSLRVFPCFVDSNRLGDVQLRGSKGNIDSGVFRQKAVLFRDGSTPEGLSLRAMAVSLIGNEIDARLDALAFACPDQWKVDYYSPYRVFVLAYALVSDDLLLKSQSEITGQMQSLETWLHNNRGIDCPSDGQRPYGEQGYIYCTPMSLFFSEGVQNDLLNRIDDIV